MSSELLETLRERAYVRGGGDPFLITEELALLATDLVAAFEPSHAAVGREPITAPFGMYQGTGDHVTDPWLLQIGACAARLEQTRMARALRALFPKGSC